MTTNQPPKKTQTLEVGDLVYIDEVGTSREFAIVSRTTKTQFVTEFVNRYTKETMERKWSKADGSPVGGEVWERCIAVPCTEAFKNAYQILQKTQKFRTDITAYMSKSGMMTNDQAIAIAKIMGLIVPDDVAAFITAKEETTDRV